MSPVARGFRPLLLVLAITLALAGVASPAAAARLAQSDADAATVLDDAGIEITVTADATVDLGAGITQLTLERLTVPEGDALGGWAPAAPGLVVLEVGSLVAADDRGFRSRLETPFQTLLQPSTPVTWNVERTTTLLRLTPGDGTAPTDLPAGVEVEPIASVALGDAAPGSRLFIAAATVDTGAGSARITHDGLVAMRVESGAVEILSPSGLEATVGTGETSRFADGAPIDLLGNAGDADDATLLLFGLTKAPPPDAPFSATVSGACGSDCTHEGMTLAIGATEPASRRTRRADPAPVAGCDRRPPRCR